MVDKLADKKNIIALLVLFFIISFIPKLIRFNDPYFGIIIQRSMETISGIEGFVHEGINFSKARVNIAGWPGYIFLECPIFQALAAWISQFTHNAFLTTKVLNLIFGGLSAFLVFVLAYRWFNLNIAFYSFIFFVFNPLNITYHKSLQVDVCAVFLALSAHVALLCWVENRRRVWLAIFTLAALLCVLIKPLFLFPMLCTLGLILKKKIRIFKVSQVVNALRKYIEIVLCLFIVAVILFMWIQSKPQMLSELGLGSLINPKYYILLVARFLKRIVTPFELLLFMVGAAWIWRNYRKKNQIQILFVPVLYYLVFSNNYGHSYYSLILIPYFSIISGCGASWVENAVLKDGLIKSQFYTKLLVCSLVAVTTALIYYLTLTSFMLTPNTLYKEIARDVTPHLDPVQYSIVYLNEEHQWPLSDRLRYRTEVVFKSFLHDLSGDDVSKINRYSPVHYSAFMYALKQYGEVRPIKDIESVSINNDMATYHGQLRYVMFYLFDNKQKIISRMKPYSITYQSDLWIVYDLKPKG